MDLPAFLLNRIKRGQVVLFLGAGVSVGSTNRKGKSPPMAAELAAELSSESGIPFHADDDLSTVASNAQRRLGEHAYWSFLKERYQNCRPSQSLKVLANYPWRRIYTLNIDDALEVAFRDSIYSYQQYVHNSPVFQRPDDHEIVQIIHLNGSIDRLEAGLIFTSDEYAEQQGKLASWYEEVARDFLSYTFLFVGTKLAEPLFQHHVDRMMRATGQRNGTAYIVCPSFSPNRKAKLEEVQNVFCLEGTASDLVKALEHAIGQSITASQVMSGRNSAIRLLVEKLGADEVMRFAGELEALDVVHPDLMRIVAPDAQPGIRSFYFGSAPTWRDIIDGVPATLSKYETLNHEISRGGRVVLVHGPAGCGKSTGMMSAAFKAALDNPDGIVFWFNGETSFPSKVIEKIAAVKDLQLFIFVDNVGMHSSDLAVLIPRLRSKVTFVLADRTNQLPGRGTAYYVEPDVRVSLSNLSEPDIDAILGKLEQFGPWHYLGKLTVPRRRAALSVIAQKQLLVGLREATEGTGYDEIAASEYNQLAEGYASAAYLLIALATMHRVPLSTQTFDIAIAKIIPERAKLPPARLTGLEGVAFEERGWLRIRHQILADFCVRKIAERDKVIEAIEAIFHALSRFNSPIRKFTNKAETRLFAALTNHDFLWSMFRSERNDILRLFSRSERAFELDALFWLQYSLFEQKCGPRQLPSAVNHIRIALSIYPESYQVLHAYANIHFGLAMAEDSASKALMLMEQASKIIEQQIESSTSEAYAAVALYHGRIAVLKKHFPERLASELKDAEERLREAFAHDPSNSTVKSALNQLHLEAVVVSSQSKSRRRTGKGRWSGVK